MIPQRATGPKLTIDGDWVFKVPSFKFDAIELVSEDTNTFEISLGILGIGLPEPEYLTATKHLY